MDTNNQCIIKINVLDEGNTIQFAVKLSKNYITIKQANCILDRSTELLSQLQAINEKIYKLYGYADTLRLMENLSEIIAYSHIVLGRRDNDFDYYFHRMDGFCGEIENILTMIRCYDNLFKE